MNKVLLSNKQLKSTLQNMLRNHYRAIVLPMPLSAILETSGSNPKGTNIKGFHCYAENEVFVTLPNAAES